MSSDAGNEVRDEFVPESSHDVAPFKGEIVDLPNTGTVVVLIGYHKLEETWGRAVSEEFKAHVIDHGGKVVFCELQDPQRADTGLESPQADAEIARFLKGIGNVEMIIDVHEHPGALATEVRNQWSLTTDSSEVIHGATETIEDLRTLPFDNYSRRKTGGQNIP